MLAKGKHPQWEHPFGGSERYNISNNDNNIRLGLNELSYLISRSATCSFINRIILIVINLTDYKKED